MDAAGAAIATVLAQAVSVVLAQAVSVVLAVVLLLKKHLPFTLRRTDFRPNPQCRKVLDVGLPLALQECLTQISFTGPVRLCKPAGTGGLLRLRRGQ